MQRRKFIGNSISALAGFSLFPCLGKAHRMDALKDVVIGHNSHQYKIDLNWGTLDSNIYPVNDCHEMVQDSKGRILLLTNHVKNNIIVYDKSGKLLEVWGTEFPGAHGLTLNVENEEDVLYIADNSRHEVIKTTIEGKTLKVISFPKSPSHYQRAEQFIPTETAITPNGDIYIADGYGEQYISHFNAAGKLINIFGGKGKGDQYFENAHGICYDDRDKNNPCLLVTARERNELKRFSLDGKLLEIISLPGAYICRPVIHGDHVYLATIWSRRKKENSGFISILDKNNKLISAPGGNVPIYNDGVLSPMYQALEIFKHPHDVCIDDEENLYVAQWNSGRSYPIKLVRV